MKVIGNIFDVISELKAKPRTGWVDHKIPSPETVWQHSLSMRAVSRELASRYLGQRHVDHCGKLGAVHDIIESIVPDITPSMGISSEQKRELEVLAINHIGTFSAGGKRIRDLWFEFDDGATEAARFVKKVDKLHVVYLALQYELARSSPFTLQPFWDYSRKHIEGTPLVEEWGRLFAQRPANANDRPLLERRPQPPGTFELMKKQVLYKIGANPM